jgi:hypothetical protein
LRIKELSGAALESAKAEIATKHRVAGYTINSLLNELDKEEDSQDPEYQAEFLGNLSELLNAEANKLDFETILPHRLSQYFGRYAELTGVTPESLTVGAFPFFTSVCHPENRLKLKLSTDWEARPLCWSAIIGVSGDGKDNIFNLFLKPLSAIQDRDDETYQKLKRDYDEMVKNESKNSKNSGGSSVDSDLTDPPIHNWRVTKQGTLEGLADIFCAQKDNDSLLYKPELSGLLNGMGKHSKGGKSDDMEQFLDLRSGNSIRVKNASNSRIADKTSLSICGGIQPKVLTEQMGKLDDSQGFWARFHITSIPFSAPDESDKPEERLLSSDMRAVITKWYEHLRDMPKASYSLNSEAKTLLIGFREWINQRRKEETRGAMSNYLAKCKGYVGEFALMLHLLDACSEGVTPEIEVSLNVMERAIALQKYLIDQRLLFLSEAGSNVSTSHDVSTLSAIAKAILDFAKTKKAPISAKECTNGVSSIKRFSKNSLGKDKPMPSDDIRLLFKQLETFGLGETSGNGAKLLFKAI